MAPLTRICLTGAESTGKSELAQELARHFSTVAVPEFAREHALAAGRVLDVSDVEPIATGQIAQEDRIIATADNVVILDTDLLSTVVYSRHYYGTCPEWVERAARSRLAGLYLLLDIDVPWIADPARDAGADREKVQQEFEAVLREFGARHELISGSWAERRELAIAAIRGTLPP